jgi:hypothetical protein
VGTVSVNLVRTESGQPAHVFRPESGEGKTAHVGTVSVNVFRPESGQVRTAHVGTAFGQLGPDRVRRG